MDSRLSFPRRAIYIVSRLSTNRTTRPRSTTSANIPSTLKGSDLKTSAKMRFQDIFPLLKEELAQIVRGSKIPADTTDLVCEGERACYCLVEVGGNSDD
jgi:hypothetical protein